MIHAPALETMAPDRLRALQSERLHALARYVYERVPFYRQRLDEAGVDPYAASGSTRSRTTGA